MKVSREDVLHVADLARLSLKEGEIAQYQNTLEKILDSMSELQQVNTDSVEVFLNPVREQVNSHAFHTPERTDDVKDSLAQESLLQNAPDSQYGQFKLEAVMESES